MPSGNAKFEAAANAAGCAFLLSAGSAATSVATYSLLTGNLVVGAGGALVAGLSAYAYGVNCQWDQNGTPAHPGVNCNTTWERTTPSDMYLWVAGQPQPLNPDRNNVQKVLASYRSGEFEWTVEYVSATDGQTYSLVRSTGGEPNWCVDLPGPGGDPVTPSPENPPYIPDYTYTDPDDGCQINVTLNGLVQDESGTVSPVWQMEPILPATARAGGGIIGGCNFTPIVVYQGPGGPVIPPIPVTPTPTPGPGGTPWWLETIREILGGVVSNIITETISGLFEEPLPATSREIYAACEYKQDGTPETYTVNFPEEGWNDRVLSALDAIVDFQQQILLWKTPVCSGAPVPLTGDPVTINWISDGLSMASATPLRKLFTYFDDSGSSLQQTVDHWKDFTWESGPVVVSLVGTTLGKPQVWASSVEEAKRVINHAASISGTDMTKADWLVSTPKSARYGQAGTMRVNRSRDGVLGITKRPGPSGFPEGLA